MDTNEMIAFCVMNVASLAAMAFMVYIVYKAGDQ